MTINNCKRIYRRNRKAVAGCLFALLASAAWCGTARVLAEESKSAPDGIRAAISANNQFALDLYSEVMKDGGNIFFSPYSISTALAMTYEGARGKTAEEIQSVFHFSTDPSERRSAFAAIHDQLNQPNSEYQLKVANALWAQRDYKFLDEYVDTLERTYAGKSANVDFKQAAEEARSTINQWVEEKTNDKIKNLFPPGSLMEDTRLVLTNAIYFKGQWVREFDKKLTKDEDFQVGAGNTVKVLMMRQTGKDAEFNYADAGGLQILEMPYKGDQLSMLVLLPRGNDGLAPLESSLSLRNLDEWKSKLRKRRVDVFMPKFTFNSKYSLEKTLSKLGMPAAFSADLADFSGMDGTRKLSIDKVIHQAFVDVNEEGTEAAAATGVTVVTESVPPPVPVFRADHPFLFVIQEKQGGNILFLGRVANPSP